MKFISCFKYLMTLSLSACNLPSSEVISTNKSEIHGSMQEWQIDKAINFSSYKSVSINVPIKESIRNNKNIILKLTSSLDYHQVLLLTRINTGADVLSVNLSPLATDVDLVYEIFTDSGESENGFINMNRQ